MKHVIAIAAILAAWLFIGNALAEAQGLTPALPTGTAHQATLKWTPPSPIGGSGALASYNIYRSTSGGAYAKVNLTAVTAPTYVDQSVQAGGADSWCISAVDSAGTESACSAAVSAAIPTNPNAPTGRSAAVQ